MVLYREEMYHLTLAGVAQLLECRPVNQKVVGLIPGRGAHA